MSITAPPPRALVAADGGTDAQDGPHRGSAGQRAMIRDAARLLAREGRTTIAPAGATVEARSP